MTLSANLKSVPPSKKLRFGIAGAGAVAQAYLASFDNCSTGTVVAIADSCLPAAEAAAAKMQCAAYESCEQMLDQASLDALIVCTPPVTHEPISLLAISKNVHVLCEKPLSIGSESAARMLRAAEVAGVTLTMASKFRYVQDVVEAKNLVASGAIGEVVLWENVFTSRVDMSGRWNAVRRISGGGVLIDNGTHSVDLMRYFMGPIAEVDVFEGKRSQGLPVEETVCVFIRSRSGIIGSVDLSWSIAKNRDSYIEIYGSEGTISIGWQKSTLRRFSDGKCEQFGTGYSKVQAFRNQIDNFSRAIQGEEPLVIDGTDAMASVQVIEAAYAALRQHRWTAVNREMEPGNSEELRPGLVRAA